ncbi:metal-dependent hydrolase [Novosphingobium lentum]|uniref:metal-dependent hydrolase n=1 Tax=Novosphingobium lentum TaxID=145287 RepID=UPI00082F5AB7|nr:metal-dependent hydrolase [Novosphingobium lentum]
MKARFPKFDFSNLRAHWAPNWEFAQRANAASLIPAHIEPYLLKVMMQAKQDIDPAKVRLHEDLDIFIKQEMQHCRQHIAFNKRMHALGYELLKPIEQDFAATFARFLATKSLRFNLAYSEGFESLSATACELYFEDYNELLEDADPEPTNMWRWHLAEEFEHRTVCSDVYHELSGLNPVFAYFYRLYGYFYAVLHLGRFQLMVSRKLLEQDRATMSPDELTASLARDKYARKIMGRRFFSNLLKICSPFYDPLKRREPVGYRAYLQEFEARYDRGPVAAAA